MQLYSSIQLQKELLVSLLGLEKSHDILYADQINGFRRIVIAPSEVCIILAKTRKGYM